MAFELVCCMKSWDSSVYNHLMPIANHELISKLWIVRPQISAYGDIPKAEYILTPGAKPVSWWKMYRACVSLGRREQVRAFVSFNPTPYGIIAYRAARKCHKPIHIGFIGSDWYYRAKGRWARWVLPVVKQAAFVTATGRQMRDEMIAAGIDSSKVATLPNSIDLRRYAIVPSDKARRYAAVFVGSLIPLKQVDVILQGWADVVKKYPAARLCIVGDGPAGGQLKQLAEQLGIGDVVDFVGRVGDVREYVATARINIIASVSEGFPFSMVEAIASGLVPVSTPVGTIPDIIQDGKNGMLFPVGDAAALARCIMLLLGDEDLYNRLRQGALELREGFGFDRATAVWDSWLGTIGEN